MGRKGRNLILYSWLAIVAIVVFKVISLWATTNLSVLSGETFGVDDANIYFRYAKNIGAGEGIVWNAGGERVEGVSSLLWTFVCVAAFKLSRQPEHLLYLLNLSLTAFSVWASILTAAYVIASQTQKIDSSSPPLFKFITCSLIIAPLLLGWVYINPAFITWNIYSLLDTGLWSTLITTLCCATSLYAVTGWRAFRVTSYTMIFLLPACRPEGMLISAAGVAAFLVAEWLRRHTFSSTMQHVGIAFGSCATSLVLLWLSRLLYFGYPFPNTYYAKVDADHSFNFEQGWKYLSAFAENYSYAAALAIALIGSSCLALVLCISIFLLKRSRPMMLMIACWGVLIAAGAFVPLWVGGDHFNWWRFLQPYWICVLAGSLLLADSIQPRRFHPFVRVLIVAPAVVVVLTSQYSASAVQWRNFSSQNGLAHEFQIALKGRRIGTDLNSIFRTYQTLPTIGALTVGGVGDTYSGAVNDLLALNNVEMAHASTDRKSFIKNHSAFNKDVFLRQRPTFLFLMADYCSLASPQKMLDVNGFYAASMKQIHSTPEFNNLYTPIVVWDEKLLKEGTGICGYALKEELQSSRATFAYKTL